MIHYITSNGVGNAWVGNELSQLSQRNIPFVLHSLHGPQQTYFKSPAVNEINQKTKFIYPISPVKLMAAVCSGPFVFGQHFWFALLNSFFGRKESFSVRLKSHFAFCGGLRLGQVTKRQACVSYPFPVG